ncbi:hypothetical protein, partial [Pseudoalteromonas espejiana]|uniref:hypothetical protein n=1 Tax=Pseudoalteromonas espejiana TaxID=28107 RepID=UPI001BE44C44
LFYVLRKVKFSIFFSKAQRLLSEAPLCEQCFSYQMHWRMIVKHFTVTLHRCGHYDSTPTQNIKKQNQ